VTASVRAVGSFSGIKVEGAADLRVTVGKRTAVTVRGDDNIVKVVETTVSDGSLGAGTMRIERIRSARLRRPSAERDSSSSAAPHISSSSRSTVTGSADASGLTARSVIVVVSGTGAARVTATHTLDATVSGTGTVVYGGGARIVRTHISGSGSVVPS
jgi:hypothetical protein